MTASVERPVTASRRARLVSSLFVTVQPYAAAGSERSAVSYQRSATAISIHGQRWGRGPSARTEKL